VIRFVDEDKRNPRPSGLPADSQVRGSGLEELCRGLPPEMLRPKPGPDALAAALEAVQRLAAEADAEEAADDTAQDLTNDSTTIVCRVCGYRNRTGNKFCGMCGLTVNQAEEPESAVPAEQRRPPSRALALQPNAFSDHEAEAEVRPPSRTSTPETHHYHHHYHHHYFPGGPEGTGARSGGDAARIDPARELRSTAALRGDMSRAEAAVRRITHEWVLACNTKHLDDLLDLYVPDALVLRSNCPPIRGAAAVREFFFGALDAGLGEVEVEPLRVEVVGDLAYEAGRCKALIPSASGKRREERGKYLWVCARQSHGEWKVVADCWSSDLTLSALESDVPQSAGIKTGQPRKNP
jgi:ketosteroid isomerase-like protein